MIVYNVTSNIDESIHDQWLDFMQNKHIQSMLATGKFSQARLVKVLVEEEMGGVTYSIQYTAANKEDLSRFYAEDAPALRQEILALFADKVLTFRTELEIISEH